MKPIDTMTYGVHLTIVQPKIVFNHAVIMK